MFYTSSLKFLPLGLSFIFTFVYRDLILTTSMRIQNPALYPISRKKLQWGRSINKPAKWDKSFDQLYPNFYQKNVMAILQSSLPFFANLIYKLYGYIFHEKNLEKLVSRKKNHEQWKRACLQRNQWSKENCFTYIREFLSSCHSFHPTHSLPIYNVTLVIKWASY